MTDPESTAPTWLPPGRREKVQNNNRPAHDTSTAKTCQGFGPDPLEVEQRRDHVRRLALGYIQFEDPEVRASAVLTLLAIRGRRAS